MKKFLLILLSAVMVSSFGAMIVKKNANADEIEKNGAEMTLKFEWTTLTDKTTEKQSAIFNVFDSIWNIQPNGTPFYIRSGDKFVYDIYVPIEQFETMKTVSGEPMTLDDISYGYFDFQRDNEDYKYLGFQDRGLKDSEGKSYDRSSYESPDKNKVSSGFVQRSVDLTPLAPGSSEFKINYSTYAHLNFNKAPKAGSVFTFYVKNMKIIGSDGTVKTDFFASTKIKSFNAEPGLFKGDLGSGQTQQGVYPTDKYGKYPISGGTVWTTKNHDLQITELPGFSVAKITDEMADSFACEKPPATTEISFDKVTATKKSGEPLSLEISVFNTDDNTEIFKNASGNFDLAAGNYYAVIEGIDDSDNDNKVMLTKYFVLGMPVIPKVDVPSNAFAGRKVYLEKVVAENALGDPIECDMSVEFQNRAVSLQGENEIYFIPEFAGEYVLIYSATNEAGTSMLKQPFNVSVADKQSGIKVFSMTIPENLRAEGQRKYGAISLHQLEESDGIFYSPDYILSYEVYSNIPGAGFLGVMTDRGTSTDWKGTDVRPYMADDLDQNGISLAYTTDLTSEFKDGWYKREAKLPADFPLFIEGKNPKIQNIVAVVDSVAFTGEKINVYFRNIVLKDSAGKVIYDFTNAHLKGGVPGDEAQNDAIIKGVYNTFNPVVESELNICDMQRGKTVDFDALVEVITDFEAVNIEAGNFRLLFGDTLQELQSGNTFTFAQKGNYTLLYDVEYEFSNQRYQLAFEKSFTVEKYNVKPQIVLKSDYENLVDDGEEITIVGASASNPIGESLKVNITVKKDGKIILENAAEGDKFVVEGFGTYFIVYSCTDLDGNRTEIIKSVTVLDTTPPQIEVSGSLPETLKTHETVSMPAASAIDAVDGEVKVIVNIYKDSEIFARNYSGTQFTPLSEGEYKFVYTAVDYSQNEVSEENQVVFVVVVTKNDAKPVISLGEKQTQVFVGNEVTIAEYEITDMFDDSVKAEISVTYGTEAVKVSNGRFIADREGEYVVTISATNSLGNTESISYKVTVVKEKTGCKSSLDIDGSITITAVLLLFAIILNKNYKKEKFN